MVGGWVGTKVGEDALSDMEVGVLGVGGLAGGEG